MRTIAIILALLAIASGTSLAVSGFRGVHRVEGKNIVSGTGEELEFALAAEPGIGGSILVKLAIPSTSKVANAAYLDLLLIARDGRNLLSSKLLVEKGPNGELISGFQIDESLARQASIWIITDPKVANRELSGYRVSLEDYLPVQPVMHIRRPATQPADEPDHGERMEKVYRGGVLVEVRPAATQPAKDAAP